VTRRLFFKKRESALRVFEKKSKKSKKGIDLHLTAPHFDGLSS
jgi:hypothetical protein